MPYVRDAACPYCGKEEAFTFELNTLPHLRSKLIRCNDESSIPKGCGKDYVVYWDLTVTVSNAKVGRQKAIDGSKA